jgi:hypothetical protein
MSFLGDVFGGIDDFAIVLLFFFSVVFIDILRGGMSRERQGVDYRDDQATPVLPFGNLAIHDSLIVRNLPPYNRGNTQAKYLSMAQTVLSLMVVMVAARAINLFPA